MAKRAVACQTSDSLGQAAAEYVIIVVAIAVALIVAIRSLAGSFGGQFQNATETINKVGEEETSPLVGKTLARENSVEQAAEGSANKGERLDSVDAATAARAARTRRLRGSEDLDSQVATLSRGVGESEKTEPDEIKLDWMTIGALSFFVVAIGAAVVMYMNSGKRKSKAKKRKKGLFKFRPLKDEGGQVLV